MQDYGRTKGNRPEYKGREGIINLLKPAGMTSHDAVSFLRRLIGVKRIGHTGTLDPMAVGVLPLCIGSAARITEYLDMDWKAYRCELQLGVETDTLDIWGQVLADRRETAGWNDILDETAVRRVLADFLGVIEQIPPKYSAIRVAGKRLYEYARNGEAVEIKPRKIVVKDIGLVRLDGEKKRITFDVQCSKGTYVRSICAELGERLGCGAAMSFLVRTGSGFFHIDEAVTLEELKEHMEHRGTLDDLLISADAPLECFGEIYTGDGPARRIANGGRLYPEEARVIKKPQYSQIGGNEELGREVPQLFRSAYRVYRQSDGAFVGVAVYREQEDCFIADKIFWKQGGG